MEPSSSISGHSNHRWEACSYGLTLVEEWAAVPVGFIKLRHDVLSHMNGKRIIGFVSGKGGVGKTTVSVNTGVALRQMGKQVTLVDTDFSASNLATYLGRYDHPVNIQDVLHGEEPAEAAVFQHPTGLQVMTASNEVEKVDPDTSGLRQVLESVAQGSEYVLVDCPPGINATVNSIMDACDEVVIVTEPTQTAGINAAQVVERALKLRKPVLGTVINKCEDDPDKELIEKEVEIMTNTHIMSKIPYDGKVKESLFNNKPVLHHEPLAEASIEIKRLAASMEGRQYSPPRFAKLRRKLRALKDKMQK